MRKFYILILTIASFPSFAQYYLRGQVNDEKGKALPYITIKVKSTGLTYKSGDDGSFGLPSSKQPDSLYFSFDGYQSQAILAIAKQALKVVLKKIPTKKTTPNKELRSYIQNVNRNFKFWTYYNESYTSLVENPFVKSSSLPVSLFSVNTNRASYSNVRRVLNDGDEVPPDAVRIEEMLNYFKFYYQEPKNEKLFDIKSAITDCPWEHKNKILFLNISARNIEMCSVPPSNLVFLIDISGSMDVPKKLPLIKAGLKLLLKNIRPIDTVSLVTYGGGVKIVIEGVSGNEKDKMIKLIDSLSGGGDTPGEAAIKIAYKIARKRLNKNSNNRIILATDGDFNIGSSSEKDLASLIESQSNAGIYLTCIGVGMGNYKDSKLSTMAHNGKGNFSYIDNELEAEKVMLTEFTQTMYSVADGVFVSVKIDSNQTKEYRLIGYDNKRTDMADTANKIKGGEIGSGQSVMAMFEIVPGNIGGGPIASAKIHYRNPGSEEENEPLNYECPSEQTSFNQLPHDLQKALCIAYFGLKLKESDYLPKTPWKKMSKFAEGCFNKEIPIEKEFLSLITKARKIYQKKWLGIF